MVKDAGDLAAGDVAGNTRRDAAGGQIPPFRRFIFDELPEYLRDVAPPADRTWGAGVNLQKMFGESFRFSSEPEPGLELVDIVTNALRRGLIGNLGETGWLPLCGPMIHRSDVYVSPVGLLPPGRKLACAAARHEQIPHGRSDLGDGQPCLARG